MKTSSFIVLALSTLFILFMTSSSWDYYKSTGVNAPLLSDADQLHLVGAGTTPSNTYANGRRMQYFDVQAAYSPIRHLGIIGQYTSNLDLNFHRGTVSAFAHFGELGAGGYYAFGEGKFQLVMDTYLGGGLGKLNGLTRMNKVSLFNQVSACGHPGWTLPSIGADQG